jgi:hypothetical protein
MLGSASSEFIALCQSQVLLLTQALGASSTVVYLAEQSRDLVSPTLVPLVAYPDNADVWAGLENALSTIGNALPATAQTDSGFPSLPVFESVAVDSEQPFYPPADGSVSGQGGRLSAPDVVFAQGDAPFADDSADKNASAQPLILPLAHEGIVLGVMVSTRDAPAWNRDDYQQAERVAKSLAIACVMDQRNQWLQGQLQQRQLTQTDQSQTFHDLLHQFRNPLTALQTFGKLLLKRIQADDPNHPIAEGIVRETGRLQDMAQAFDEAIARGDTELADAAMNMPLEQLLLPGSEATLEPIQDEDLSSQQGQVDQSGPAPSGPEGRASNGHAAATSIHSASTESNPEIHSLGRAVNLIPGSISAVVEPLLVSAEAIAQDRDITLVEDIPADLPEVWLDDPALGEVIRNLLDNAFKYAPRGSLVWVAGGLVQHLHDTVYQGIAVGDSGPGIPLQDQDRIFERHYRGVQAHSPTPGTGLGLAIVRELVEAMGGKIDLISPIQIERWLPNEKTPQANGPGSLFIIWLKTV